MIRKYWKLIGIGLLVLLVILVNNLSKIAPPTAQNTGTNTNRPGLNLTQPPTREDVVNPTSTELQKLALEQSYSDQAFTEASIELEKIYPWFNKLPIETNEYKLLFDYELQQFRIRVKPGVNQTTAVNNALNKLKELGVNDPKYYVLL